MDDEQPRPRAEIEQDLAAIDGLPPGWFRRRRLRALAAEWTAAWLDETPPRNPPSDD